MKGDFNHAGHRSMAASRKSRYVADEAHRQQNASSRVMPDQRENAALLRVMAGV